MIATETGISHRPRPRLKRETPTTPDSLPHAPASAILRVLDEAQTSRDSRVRDLALERTRDAAAQLKASASMDALLIYIDDWESSKKIAMMDAFEELGYFHLLMAAAKEPDCGLPDDDSQLAILSKLGPQWKRITRDRAKRIADEQGDHPKTSGDKLRGCFFPGGTADPKTSEIAGRPARLYNSRLLEVHRQYLVSTEQRRKAAAARWNGKHTQKTAAGNRDFDAAAYPPALRPDMRNGCGEHPNPISNPNTTASPTSSPEINGYDSSSGWNWFQAEYPKHRLNPHMDLRLWLSIVTSLEIERQIRDKLPRFKAQQNGRRTVAVWFRQPQNFLGNADS